MPPLALLVLLTGVGPACETSWRRAALAWDTAASPAAVVEHLRADAKAHPKDGERWLDLGTFLVLVVSEADSAWRGRVEAEEALNRAFQLLPGDARPTAGLAVLRSRQGARVDARRLTNRALKMGQDDPGFRCFEAELHYQMARIYRTWWEDWENLHNLPSTAPQTARCSRFSDGTVPVGAQGIPMTSTSVAREAPVMCPEAFYERMGYAQDWSDLRHDDRDRMLAELEAALATDSAHRDARRDLLLARYELGDWTAFDRAVEEGLRVGADPWVRLWAAAGGYDRRRLEEARRFLDSALALLPEADRAVLLEPARLLAPAAAAAWKAHPTDVKAARDSVFWRASDPLFLTEENERLLAHAARVVYAVSKFSVPSLAALGPDTDAGTVWVRYGRPWRRWTLVTGESLEGTQGRTTYWAYDSLSPPIVLNRFQTMRRWRFSELAQDAFERNVDHVPQHWRPTEAFEVWDSLPILLARFEQGDTIVYDAYGWWTNPDTAVARDSVRVGFFVFDGVMKPLVERRVTAPARDRAVPLRFRVPLAPSSYRYSIETLAEPGRAVRRARGMLEVPPARRDTLRVSDLLLGRRVRALPPVIGHRDQLRLDPLYDLALDPGDSLAVYWESYGLEPDTAGRARYRVTVSVEDSTRTGVAGLVGRLGAALGLGERRGIAISWDVEAGVANGVRRDVIVLDPPEWSPSTYLLRVEVTEAATGRSARAERLLRMGPTNP